MNAGQDFLFQGNWYVFNHWGEDGSANAVHKKTGCIVWLAGVAQDTKTRLSNERKWKRELRERKAAAKVASKETSAKANERILRESHELIHKTPALRRLLEEAVAGRLNLDSLPGRPRRKKSGS
jgi:hypothetical protein